MFRILCDPSSGSTELCLTEITGSDSQIFCHVLGRCVFGSIIFNMWCVCVCVCTVRPASQPTVTYTHGSRKIRSMSE